MISKIMIAFDFSDYSKEALKYAAELAQKLKVDLIITNVINQRDVDAIKYTSIINESISVKEYINRQIDKRSRRMNKLMEETSLSHVPAQKVFKVGTPFYELIQAAKDEEANVVVIGIKGRTNLKGIHFGTTAEKMFRHCPVPLLSIRIGPRR